MYALVGDTGFVGSNLYRKGGFDCGFHSRNIGDAYGLKPELLVYAGLRAEKYLANRAPEKDLELIRQAEENIRRIAPEKLVLISTVDVFRDPRGVDESSPVETEGLQAYGLNRYRLECRVRERYPDALIVRLPGLFGKNIKKNFIFDYIRRIPQMLNGQKFQELSARAEELARYYELQDNGFYRCRKLDAGEEAALREIFCRLGFSALCFTDSRSRYQFYPLDRLWEDIQTALRAGLTLWHPATEPVTAGELYEYLEGEPFVNELPGTAADYDYRTRYDRLFGGDNGYILGREDVMEAVRKFVLEEMRGSDEG